jgi:uncharacterized membrane protein
MLYPILKSLHLLSVIVWIGGMVFAHFFLRPALTQLEPGVRVRLMHAVLGRFFQAVLVLALLTLVTGSWMIGRTAKQMFQAGLAFHMPIEWMVMSAFGAIMVIVFAYIRFVLYVGLGRVVTAADWPTGALVLAKIRMWVLVNLVLGVVIVLVTLMGAAV